MSLGIAAPPDSTYLGSLKPMSGSAGRRRFVIERRRRWLTSVVTVSAVNDRLPCLVVFCISTALLFHPNAQAWSGAGHQVIAAEAYRRLSADLQKKVTEILEAHPDYEKWEKSFTSESASVDLPTFIFMRSLSLAKTLSDEAGQGGGSSDRELSSPSMGDFLA